MRFVDTNILLYAVSTDSRERTKADVARSILNSSDLALSVQVLQEFYVQSTRHSRGGALSHEQAERLINAFSRFPVQETTIDVLESALGATQRFRISFWDATIIEAARKMNCSVLLSEGLNHGQDYDGVRVQNPFK